MKDELKKHGAFSWTELMTTDVSGATGFYKEIFGWETEDYPMGEMTYKVVKVDDEPVAGIMPMPPQCQGMPPHWSTYITVDDVDVVAKKVEELGGENLFPPTDIPNVGRFCVIQDPQGGVICAMQYAEEK